MAFISGKRGYVAVYDDSTGVQTEHTFKDWSFPARAEFIKRNSFPALGWQTGVSGFKSVKIRCSGPYSLDQAPLSVGSFYWFYLGLTDEGYYEYEVYAHISELTPKNDAENGPELEIVADSVGEFAITTV